MSNESVVAVDIGGTWTRVAAAHAGQLGRIIRTPTRSDDAVAFVHDLVTAIEAVRESLPDASSIGVSATGPVNPLTGRLYTPPNMDAGLAGLPLGELLAARTGLPVAVDRDTNCALLAEVACGAAVGYRNVVFATVSTGVGAAVLLGGRLLRGRDGVAGELGHLVVDPAGPLCGCGRRGCLEAIAAGPAIAQAAGLPDGASVTAAAASGDERAQAALKSAGDALASACVDWANAFNPELIVFGGSVARAHPSWVTASDDLVAMCALAPASDRCRVTLSTLGDEVGLLGAAILAERSGGSAPR